MLYRNARILVLVAASSLPLLAQQPGSTSQPDNGSGQTVSGGAVPVTGTANSPEVANPELRPITGELVNKLDTKNAKVGDSVVIKTTAKATTAGGVEIPKGSKIVGHVTDAEAKGKSGDNSRVTIQFDQAELKGGQNLPIRSVIQSVAPPAGMNGPEVAAPSAMPSAGPTGAGGSPGGSSSPSSGSPSSGAAQSTPTPSVSAQSSSSDSPQASGAPAPGTVVARNGNVAIRTTAIPGVLLAGNANGQPFSNASGALLGARQNVHLDGGTTMVVAIATAPSPAPVR